MQNIQKLAVPAAIAIVFFVFGFFITANLLGLSLREILVGLVAGAVGGLTTLTAVMHQARPAQAVPVPTR